MANDLVHGPRRARFTTGTFPDGCDAMAAKKLSSGGCLGQAAARPPMHESTAKLIYHNFETASSEILAPAPCEVNLSFGGDLDRGASP